MKWRGPSNNLQSSGKHGEWPRKKYRIWRVEYDSNVHLTVLETAVLPIKLPTRKLVDEAGVEPT